METRKKTISADMTYFIDILAEYIRKQFNNASCLTKDHGLYLLASTELGNQIKQEITQTLGEIEYTDCQEQILKNFRETNDAKLIEDQLIKVITGQINPNPNFVHAKDAFVTNGLIGIYYQDLAFKTFFTKPNDEKACTHLTTDTLKKHENRKKKVIFSLFNFLALLASDDQLKQLLTESKDMALMHPLLDTPKLVDPVMKPLRKVNDAFQLFSHMDRTDKYHKKYCEDLFKYAKNKDIDVARYFAPKV